MTGLVKLFAAAERELWLARAPFVLEIEHIGSTAVPASPAKPVVDIHVGVRTLDDSAEIVSAVEALGYEYVPEFEDELPDRRYSRRWVEGRRSYQIHLVERSNTDWWIDRQVSGLASHHDDDRDRYAELEMNLAATHREDRRAQGRSPTSFVR